MKKQFTQEQTAEIAALYKKGQTTYQIGERFGVSANLIARILDRQGVELRPSGKPSEWEGTPEQRVAMVAAYRSGMSVPEIQRQTKCGTTRILRVLKEEGVEIRPRGSDVRVLTDPQIQEAVKMYQGSITLKEIGKHFGVADMTVRNYLVREGITLRPPGVSLFWTEERKDEAVRRYQAGESQQAIADSWGVGQVGVSVALRSRGISTRKPQWRNGNPNWAGGRYVDNNGYVQIKPSLEDMHFVPMLSTGYVLEHRLVMAKTLGRPLLKTETVHHIDGDKTNNSPGNLQLRQGNHGKGIVLHCADCGSPRVAAVPLP